mgnify:CR=1 FL=1
MLIIIFDLLHSKVKKIVNDEKLDTFENDTCTIEMY